MKFKSLTLAATFGLFITANSVFAAQPQHLHQTPSPYQPTVTPVYCNECGKEFENSGEYVRFNANPWSEEILFGMADLVCGKNAAVGLRIDANGLPAHSWQIKMITNGRPFFITVLQFPDGTIHPTTALSYMSLSGTTFRAGFNGLLPGAEGATIVSVYVWDSGRADGGSFIDIIGLRNNSLLFNGVQPLPVLLLSPVPDCDYFSDTTPTNK